MFVGQRIANRYELRREIGRGAMGHVFLAEDARLRRSVAVKLIAPTQDEAAFRRAYAMFAAEARVSAMMTHPNIVTVYDFIDDDDTPALVMELVEGESMAARLARGERWTIDGAAQLLAQVCDGLSVAHASGLVHRDLKPANLMLPTAGGIKILDFGIAHSDQGTSDNGAILGTPNYMSPEQVRGGAIDARSDLWAVGAIGFEMTTQVRPFSGDNATAVVFEVLNTEPTWSLLSPSGTPYEGILRRALTKDARLRWGGAADLAAAFRSSTAASMPLAGYLPVSGQQSNASGAWQPSIPQVERGASPARNLAPLVAGIVTTILLAVGISIFYAESVVGGRTGGGGGGGVEIVRADGMVQAERGERFTDVVADTAGTAISVSQETDAMVAPAVESVQDDGGTAETTAGNPLITNGAGVNRTTSSAASAATIRREELVRRGQDEKVRRSVARLLDDGAYEDAWAVLATNDGIASADILLELRQRVRRACNADNEDLRSRGQPTVVCP